MTTATTIEELAQQGYDGLELAERPAGGGEYVRVREDGAPEWLQELARHAHGDMLPNDWRYECIRAALEHIAENGADDDAGYEFADGHIDVYTGALIEWLGSHGHRPGYCDEAAVEYGAGDDADITKRMQLGQFFEAREVFELVRGRLEELADELSEQLARFDA